MKAALNHHLIVNNTKGVPMSTIVRLVLVLSLVFFGVACGSSSDATLEEVCGGCDDAATLAACTSGYEVCTAIPIGSSRGDCYDGVREVCD